MNIFRKLLFINLKRSSWAIESITKLKFASNVLKTGSTKRFCSNQTPKSHLSTFSPNKDGSDELFSDSDCYTASKDAFDSCLDPSIDPTPGLMQFFDRSDVWGEAVVLSGRPWRMDELRLKSTEDLHQLWYTLLKERNMLMSMEEEHERRQQHQPNSERLEKCEESMENLLWVVEERDLAAVRLESGHAADLELGETYQDADLLGRRVDKLAEERLEPRRDPRETHWFGETNDELHRLEREAKRKRDDDREFWRRVEFERQRIDKEDVVRFAPEHDDAIDVDYNQPQQQHEKTQSQQERQFEEQEKASRKNWEKRSEK